MLYRGREVDVVSLWGQFVDLPENMPHPLPSFLPKVRCPNPAHDTMKRHFQINTVKPLVHCFARCGIQGTYEHAISVITGCTEKEARRAILKHSRVAGIKGAVRTTPRRRLVQETDPVSADEKLLRGGAFRYLPKVARGYLDSRGIEAWTRGKWEIGWDEDNERLVIPAYDEDGRFRFLIRRALSDHIDTKYLYTEGTSKTSLLFGACHLDRDAVRSHGLIFVEGSIDTILLHQMGFRNAVGILGTGISKRQARIVDKLNPPIIFNFFDRDTAGVSNLIASYEALTKYPHRVVRYPKGKDDPAEMSHRAVARQLDRAMPYNLFMRKVGDLQKEVLV